MINKNYISSSFANELAKRLLNDDPEILDAFLGEFGTSLEKFNDENAKLLIRKNLQKELSETFSDGNFGNDNWVLKRYCQYSRVDRGGLLGYYCYFGKRFNVGTQITTEKILAYPEYSENDVREFLEDFNMAYYNPGAIWM